MKARIARSPYCCGLYEIGAFGADPSYYEEFGPKQVKKSGMAFYCVTRWSDVKEKLWLKKNGFKRVGRWKNPNTGRNLTLWVRMPDKKKK